MGCGLCHDSCPRKCIKITHGKDGIYPEVNSNTCTLCGLCLRICAGTGLDIGKKAKDYYAATDTVFDKYSGYIHECFAGYSNDKEIRLHSASGGCASRFLIFLLEHGYIDGAVVVGFRQKAPMRPHVYIAKTKEEILSARSSKYCTVSYENIVRQILSEQGRYAIMGLPCHIHAFRKYESAVKRLSRYIFGYFSIYCSSNRTLRSQEYLLYRYGVKKEDVHSFAYRDNGCLGSMYFRDKRGLTIRSVPYETFWSGMRGFFNVPRCSLCIDHYGELADICFGDIHIDRYKEDRVGVNSVISRSLKWTILLKEAEQKGYLSLERITVGTINKSQQYAMKQKKGAGVAAAYKVRKCLCLKTPDYDVAFVKSADLKSIIKDLAKYIMRFIGRHKSMWFIIKLTDKN